MSTITLKNKSNVIHGSNVSGTRPGGIWISRNASEGIAVAVAGNNGFSINGGNRSSGYIGKGYGFSQNRTKFKGAYPTGYGGLNGTYINNPIQIDPRSVVTRGVESKYIKPSVLSTKGMLSTKYPWIRRPFP
jgi:hypothetical protein